MRHITEYFSTNINHIKPTKCDADINDILYISAEDHDWFWFFQVIDKTTYGYKLQSIRPEIINKEWIPSDEKQGKYDGYIEDNEIKVDYNRNTYTLKPYTKYMHLLNK